MRAAVLGACVCVSVAAVHAAIQEKPDFSGRWYLVDANAPASIPREMTVRQTRGSGTTAGAPTQRIATITIARHLQGVVESEVYVTESTAVFPVSRAVAGERTPPDQRHQRQTAAKWEGDRLTIGRATYVDDQLVGERYEVWSLADGILSITVGEKSPAIAAMRPVTFTYQRSAPTVLGSIGGFVRDIDGSAVPGARVRVIGVTENSAAVSDAQGRYRLDRIPLGTWRVEANLSGFRLATCDAVVVREAQQTSCDFVLRVGRLAHVDYVLPAGGLAGAVRAADIVAHVRIVQPIGPALIGSAESIATEHRAMVLATIKGPGADLGAGREVRLWQEQAGEWTEDGQRIVGQFPPFRAGEELVGFFRRGAEGRIQSYVGDHLMFRIVDAKVASTGCCGRPWHGIENGTPLNDLLAQLRKLAG